MTPPQQASGFARCCWRQELEAAFAALETVVGTTPWELTDNFVGALREGRGRLVLQGPGDPTGRGLGFSYLRDERKVSRHSPDLHPALSVSCSLHHLYAVCEVHTAVKRSLALHRRLPSTCQGCPRGRSGRSRAPTQTCDACPWTRLVRYSPPWASRTRRSKVCPWPQFARTQSGMLMGPCPARAAAQPDRLDEGMQGVLIQNSVVYTDVRQAPVVPSMLHKQPCSCELA